MITLAVLAVALQVAQPPARPGIITYGTGTYSCGRWTQDLRQGQTSWPRITNVAWLGGFMTGINATQRLGNVTASTDMPAMVAWIDNYCAANPLDNVATAAQRLVAELATRQGL